MFKFLRRKKELKVPTPPSAEHLPSFPTPKTLGKASPEELKAAAGTKLELKEHKKQIVEKERETLAEARTHTATKPIFIHAPTYKALMDEIDQMKVSMSEAEDIVETLETFKEDQDKAFKSWQSNIKNVHEKLIYIDETLFKR